MVRMVVEHLEPSMGEWVVLEYVHMVEVVGKENLLVTNISEADAAFLPEGVEWTSKSVSELNLPRVAVLDFVEHAKVEFCTADKDNFDYLLFGGILGDHPPTDRTAHLRPCSHGLRHLGPEQMSTDGAMEVCWRILNGATLAEIPFCDFPLEFKIDDRETVELPFKYIKKADGSPNIPTGLLPILLADFSLADLDGVGEDWVLNKDDILDQ